MTLYTYGYIGNGVPPLQQLAAAGVLIVDIRNAPTSRWRPEYKKDRLARVLGDRYRYLGDLGNINHRDRSLPMVLRHPEQGCADLAALLEAGDVCILCGCADWRECHRELVGRLMQERLPGLEVVHLDAGEVERRWEG